MIDEEEKADRIAEVIIRLHYQNLLTTKPHLRPLLKSWLIYFGNTLTPVGSTAMSSKIFVLTAILLRSLKKICLTK
jgi:hypothetical protein